jgi:hypothetical protein
MAWQPRRYPTPAHCAWDEILVASVAVATTLLPDGRIDARRPDFLHVSRRSCGALSSTPSTRISGCPSAGRQRQGSDPSSMTEPPSGTANGGDVGRQLNVIDRVVIHGPPSRSSMAEIMSCCCFKRYESGLGCASGDGAPNSGAAEMLSSSRPRMVRLTHRSSPALRPGTRSLSP